jgi:hypothetical protein
MVKVQLVECQLRIRNIAFHRKNRNFRKINQEIMKYLKNCQTLLIITLYALLILGSSSRLVAQEDVYLDVDRFSILVEISGDEIKLTCNDGCAWKQLSFISSIKSDPQAIDQYGMTPLPRKLIKKESLLSNFLFTIKRTQEGVSLEGKEGTAWTSLIFICLNNKRSQLIDEYGMVREEKK